MSLKTITLLLVFGVSVNGVPLETNDMSQFFSNRIWGGQPAEEGDAPHKVALVFGFQRHVANFFCGGSLISAVCVLTAAHCIEIFVWEEELSDALYGVTGSLEWNSKEHAIPFIGYDMHDKYDSWNIDNDIGVLILAHEPVWGDNVKTISISRRPVRVGERATVTGSGFMDGWILPTRPNTLTVTVMDHAECVRAMQGLFAPPVHPERELCTVPTRGEGMCNGDSGSAMVSKETNSQIGIVSWGFPCALGMPDVFVNVAAFIAYIDEQVAKHA